MDWTRAIERNREALAEIIAAIFALLETAGGAERISRPLHRAVLRVLAPAEAALRRLIVIAARGLVVELRPPRPMPALPIGRSSSRRPSFRLFDTRKHFAFDRLASGPRQVPRIHVFASDPRVLAQWRAPEPPPSAATSVDDGLIAARRITQRLDALRLALANLPRQAMRLVRLRARRATNPKLSWRSPLRPGPPPGHRKVPVHDADFVLRECHGLAWDALTPDTS